LPLSFVFVIVINFCLYPAREIFCKFRQIDENYEKIFHSTLMPFILFNDLLINALGFILNFIQFHCRITSINGTVKVP